jgi:hypothetical protein
VELDLVDGRPVPEAVEREDRVDLIRVEVAHA